MLLPLLLNNLLGVSPSISGDASVTFSQSGTVKARGKLIGDASLSFTQSGVVKGRGSLSATPTILFGEAAQVSSVNSITGATQLRFMGVINNRRYPLRRGGSLVNIISLQI